LGPGAAYFSSGPGGKRGVFSAGNRRSGPGPGGKPWARAPTGGGGPGAGFVLGNATMCVPRVRGIPQPRRPGFWGPGHRPPKKTGVGGAPFFSRTDVFSGADRGGKGGGLPCSPPGAEVFWILPLGMGLRGAEKEKIPGSRTKGGIGEQKKTQGGAPRGGAFFPVVGGGGGGRGGEGGRGAGGGGPGSLIPCKKRGGGPGGRGGEGVVLERGKKF